MARKSFQIDPLTPYHISSRCINRDWFSIQMGEVWKIMEDYLHFIHHAYKIDIHSFVLMSNHFHMLASSPNGNLSDAMAFFLRETSRYLTKESGRINRTWGGRYFRSRIGSNHYFLNVYKYVYRNPIEAGLCISAEEYPFSTLPGILGTSKIVIPLTEDTLLFDGSLEKNLSWINRTPHREHTEAIRRGLQKKEFSIAKCRATGKEHFLVNNLY